MSKKLGGYIVVSTYAGASEDELELITNELEIVGRTDDPDQMRAWGQEVFDKVIKKELDCFRDRYSKEDLEEYEKGFEVKINSKEMILDQEKRPRLEKPIIIGTLFICNDQYRYVDGVKVVAIKI